jgi:hypothetical protein
MRKLIAESEAIIRGHQDSCGHCSQDGTSTVLNSQIHNDGMIHPFCARCMKEFDPIPAKSTVKRFEFIKNAEYFAVRIGSLSIRLWRRKPKLHRSLEYSMPLDELKELIEGSK